MVENQFSDLFNFKNRSWDFWPHINIYEQILTAFYKYHGIYNEFLQTRLFSQQP